MSKPLECAECGQYFTDGYPAGHCCSMCGSPKLVPAPEPCDECEGSGEVECHSCEGKGVDYEHEAWYAGDGSGIRGRDIAHPCSHCEGEGKVTCEKCQGEGSIEPPPPTPS